MKQKYYNSKLKYLRYKSRYKYFLRKQLVVKAGRSLLKNLYTKTPTFSLIGLNIRCTQNNIFCTLYDFTNKKTIKNLSAGIQGIHTSKKSLKYACRQLLPIFLKKINKKKVKRNLYIVNLIVPKYLRRFVVSKIGECFFGQRFFLFLNEKKCFNGCRPPKQRRKKHQRYKIFA